MKLMLPRRRLREDELIRDIALQRIIRLFELAEKTFSENPSLSNRYVKLARLIAMKTRVRIPRELRRKFCHNCGCFLKVGVNCRVRLAERRSPHVAITCLSCGQTHRIPLKT